MRLSPSPKRPHSTIRTVPTSSGTSMSPMTGPAPSTSEGARILFYNDCSDAVGRLGACARLGPAPDRDVVADAARRSPGVTGPRPMRSVPSTTSSIPICSAFWRGGRRTSVEWPTGHSPFLSRPDLVADLSARRRRLGGARERVRGRGQIGERAVCGIGSSRLIGRRNRAGCTLGVDGVPQEHLQDVGGERPDLARVSGRSRP